MVQISQRVAPAVAASAYVLHMTDDLWSYDWYHHGYDTTLQRAARQVDIALGSSAAIAGRLASLGFDARELRHGVDAERFSPTDRGELTPEPALEQRARPRLGFMGNIESRLDVEVLERLAAGPGSVSLVGPLHVDSAIAERLRAAGCFLDGEVAYERVPAWMAGFDIGLLPYRQTPLVESSRPLKLLEYLAAGIPVVSVDIPAARELHPHVVTASGPQGFEHAVSCLWRDAEKILGAEARADRVGEAATESWRARAQELAAAFVEAENQRAARPRRTHA